MTTIQTYLLPMLKHTTSYLCSGKNKHLMKNAPYHALSLTLSTYITPLINFSGKGDQWLLPKKSQSLERTSIAVLTLKVTLHKWKHSSTDEVIIQTTKILHGFCNGVDVMQKPRGNEDCSPKTLYQINQLRDKDTQQKTLKY